MCAIVPVGFEPTKWTIGFDSLARRGWAEARSAEVNSALMGQLSIIRLLFGFFSLVFLWWSASATPRRRTANSARPGREQR